ncbi:MAG TPA: hypothetical protein VHB93_01410 [Candidatus Paceibacterota bacterium]|nr:hypothetical protein [Candidatus Paceibacterota bacterium]
MESSFRFRIFFGLAASLVAVVFQATVIQQYYPLPSFVPRMPLFLTSNFLIGLAAACAFVAGAAGWFWLYLAGVGGFTLLFLGSFAHQATWDEVPVLVVLAAIAVAAVLRTLVAMHQNSQAIREIRDYSME